jgi:hypothetical protein
MGNIVSIMRKVLTPYAVWFNKKYKRVGSLIANRYKSECLNNDEYLFTLLRYIHQNPMKAGIAQRMEGYRWSSYRDYLADCGEHSDREYIYSMLSPNKSEAIEEFRKMHGAIENGEHEPSDARRKTESEIRKEILLILDGREPHEIGSKSKAERNAILRELRDQGLSIRQIERATGISRGVIAKC